MLLKNLVFIFENSEFLSESQLNRIYDQFVDVSFWTALLMSSSSKQIATHFSIYIAEFEQAACISSRVLLLKLDTCRMLPKSQQCGGGFVLNFW